VRQKLSYGSLICRTHDITTAKDFQVTCEVSDIT